MNPTKYNNKVKYHLSKSATIVEKEDILKADVNMREPLNTICAHLTINDYNFIIKVLDSRSIHTPKLLIKDHKDKINGKLPSRYLVLATKFTQEFLRI